MEKDHQENGRTAKGYLWHRKTLPSKQVGHYQSKKHAENSKLSSRMLPMKELERQNKTSKQAEEPDF